MAFPDAWPPRVATSVRSIRFFTSGTATANFSDRAFMFLDASNVMTPMPYVPPGGGPSGTNFVAPITPTGTGSQSVSMGITTTAKPQLWSGNIRVCNDGGAPLEFSFDGTAIHGRVLPGEQLSYRNRYEAGIAVRGAGVAFRIEAW